MTAESIESFELYRADTAQSLGGLVIPRVSVEDNQQDQVLTLSRLTPDKESEGESGRLIGVASTLIKERFQYMFGDIKVDERDSIRARLRRESVRDLFQTFQMLPSGPEVEAPFAELYERVESDRQLMNRSDLIEWVSQLMDKYETHPAIRVFNTLEKTKALEEDDIVNMRRSSLAILDQHIL